MRVGEQRGTAVVVGQGQRGQWLQGAGGDQFMRGEGMGALAEGERTGNRRQHRCRDGGPGSQACRERSGAWRCLTLTHSPHPPGEPDGPVPLRTLGVAPDNLEDPSGEIIGIEYGLYPWVDPRACPRVDP